MGQIKTYAVHGLIEWNANLKVGALSLNVLFTGGGATENGFAPAMYTTKDKHLQKLIEASDKYKSGKIVLYRVFGNPDPEPAPKKPAEKPQQSEPMNSPVSGEVGTEKAAAKEQTSQEPQLTEVPINSLADAKTYLKEHYGINKTEVFTTEAVKAAAKQKGIVFKGL